MGPCHLALTVHYEAASRRKTSTGSRSASLTPAFLIMTGHVPSMFQDDGRNADGTTTGSSAVQRAWGRHDRSSDST